MPGSKTSPMTFSEGHFPIM